MFFFNDGLFGSLVDNDVLLLCVDFVGVSFMYNRYVGLFNVSSVFLVDDWLMVFVNVLLNNNWLMMFMNDLLMMFMDNVFLMFYQNILVVLVDDIFVDFLDDGLSDVSLNFSSKFMLLNGLAFINFLVYCFFLMFDNNWLFVYLFDYGGTVVLFGTNISF